MGETEETAASEESPSELATTVLIVSHNCADALRRSLEALKAAEQHDDFEILVVDDGSRDLSGQVDAEFPGVTVLRVPRRFGKTKARNIGARTAKGRFLLLLEPGVEVSPESVSALAGRLASEEGLLAVCPLLVDSSGEPVSRSGPLPGLADLYASWVSGAAWNSCLTAGAGPVAADAAEQAVECPDLRALLVRASFVRGMNFFDSRYGEFGSDLELVTRAFRASRPILLIPAVRAVAPGGMDPEASSGESDLLRLDHAAGLTAYAGKHFGFGAALKLRLRVLVWALVRFRLGLLFQLLSGAKVDGSQPD